MSHSGKYTLIEVDGEQDVEVKVKENVNIRISHWNEEHRLWNLEASPHRQISMQNFNKELHVLFQTFETF